MRLIAAAICYVIHWNYDCMQLAWKVLHCFLQNSSSKPVWSTAGNFVFIFSPPLQLNRCPGQSLSHFLSLSHYWVTLIINPVGWSTYSVQKKTLTKTMISAVLWFQWFVNSCLSLKLSLRSFLKSRTTNPNIGIKLYIFSTTLIFLVRKNITIITPFSCLN